MHAQAERGGRARSCTRRPSRLGCSVMHALTKKAKGGGAVCAQKRLGQARPGGPAFSLGVWGGWGWGCARAMQASAMPGGPRGPGAAQCMRVL